MWNDLKERYSQKNGPRIFQLKRAISSLKQEQLSVTSYFAKMKSLWDELSNYKSIPVCSCGALKTCTCGIMKVLVINQENEHIMYFLMGLNDCYTSVRDQILLMDPLPPMNAVFTKITQQERQREITVLGSFNSQHPIESMAMLSKYSDNKSTGNYSKFAKKDRPLCTHCGMLGHVSDKML